MPQHPAQPPDNERKSIPVTTKDNRPVQLDRLHAVLEHMEDHPGLVEHVTDIGSLWQHSAKVSIHLASETAVRPLVLWAHSLGEASVRIDQSAVNLHLRVLGKIGVHHVDVVQVLSPTPELLRLGDSPTVEALERATGLAEVNPAVREHALAELAKAGQIAHRMAKVVR